MGKKEVKDMRISYNFDWINNELKCIDEMIKIINTDLPLPLSNMHYIAPHLVEIKSEGSYMSSGRLYKLMMTLQLLDEISKFFKSQKEEETEINKFPYLSAIFSDMPCFPNVIEEINRCINKFGEVKDTASPKLLEIRSNIRAASGSVQKAIRRVLEKAVQDGIVDKEASPSIRDGRMVIPVSNSNKRMINGIVHDQSATGKTVYIEPSVVVEASNRLKELEIEEKHEIIVVLRLIADFIRPYIEDIIQASEKLGKIDFIRAKALFGIDLNAQMPTISKKPCIEWYHAIHPVLELNLRKQGRKIVPLNLQLSESQRILIISGPNAGGKSICLKTTAIVQYMMQCGLLPTLYSNSHMGIFSNIFIDIGDEQSIENDLSTYSSHLRNMKYFVTHANSRSLILADEMGTGTEPQIGGALAQAILKKLGEAHCMGVITTHYQNLKTFAENTTGFVNGAMLYDRQHLQPTFELSIGNAGSSFALDIAAKTGLPKSIIDDAKEIVGEEYINIDRYLSEIARDKRYWSNKRQNIREKEFKLEQLLLKYEENAEELKSQRKNIINEAKREAKEILETVNSKIERTILEIRKAEAEKEVTKKLRQGIEDMKRKVFDNSENEDKNLPKLLKQTKKNKIKNKKQITNLKPENNTLESLSLGDYVKLKDGTIVGNILSINGKKAEVAFGALRTIVELDRLITAAKPKASALTESTSISSSTSSDIRNRQLSFKTDIDVRGMRADEAIQAVTYFLDDAIQFSANKVRILHGTGHGILKTLIHQQLQANTGVKSFRDEDVRFGGAGITVVDLE
ncbi:MAG: Smr/MutS family protein [Roseburia sp.]|nr:Smr/MutS family protein [Roseburia sp.]